MIRPPVMNLIGLLSFAITACSDGSTESPSEGTGEVADSGQSGGEGLPVCEGEDCPADDPNAAEVEGCGIDDETGMPYDGCEEGEPLGLAPCEGDACPQDDPNAPEAEGCGIDDETGKPYENCDPADVQNLP